jgi:hypothetical protein
MVSTTKEESANSVRKTPPKVRTLAGLFPATTHSSVNGSSISKAGTRVSYSRTIRRITLQRFLISKMVHQPEKLTFVELLVMYDNLLWCQDKSNSDPTFYKTFGSFIEKLTKILKENRISEKNLAQTLKRISVQLIEAIDGHLIPERNLPNIEKYCKGKFHVVPTKDSGIPTKELPPVKVIGRGYRDKGTYRDPAWDGSPSWQELATYFARKTSE